MTARKGWCPSLFDPMPAGDGLLVRIRPPRGMLSADAARVLAEAASCRGNGIIELTGRGNLQVRGLSPASVVPFATSMVACGLASGDADMERRRNLMMSPLVGDDPSLAPETAAIAGAIERGLAAPYFTALPAKFGFLVDGGGVLPLDGVAADIRVRAEGSGFGISIQGDEFTAAALPEQAASGALRLARAFLDLSATLPTAPRRMRDLVRAVGAGMVFGAAGFERAQASRFVMAGPDPAIHGHRPTQRGVDARVKPGHGVEKIGLAEPAPPNPIGFMRYPRLERGAFGLGLPFGHMEAATLAKLADLAVRFGDRKLRTTPWRAVLLGGVAEPDVAELRDVTRRVGMIVDPADARRKIVACAGRPACASASVAARGDAAFLAAAVSSGVVHVSGCSKGCAHPRPAAVTLVGAEGRYGFVRNGTAGDAPDIAGLTIAEAADLLNSGIAA